MALDLTNPETGELDRSKVVAQVDAIFSYIPASAGARARVITLLEDVQDVAYMNGYLDCQDVA